MPIGLRIQIDVEITDEQNDSFGALNNKIKSGVIDFISNTMIGSAKLCSAFGGGLDGLLEADCEEIEEKIRNVEINSQDEIEKIEDRKESLIEELKQELEKTEEAWNEYQVQ